MPERLIGSSSVLLYGRALEDVQIVQAEAGYPAHGGEQSEEVPRGGANRFLQDQVTEGQSRLARIYGFTYEGHYYDLAKPALFLVHGPGVLAEVFRPESVPPFDRVARAPGYVDRAGTAAPGSGFAEDLRVWAYDKSDLSMRLETETGSLEQILLEAELRSERLTQSYSGQSVRLAPRRMRGAGD
jgi:hypothetical protein